VTQPADQQLDRVVRPAAGSCCGLGPPVGELGRPPDQARRPQLRWPPVYYHETAARLDRCCTPDRVAAAAGATPGWASVAALFALRAVQRKLGWAAARGGGREGDRAACAIHDFPRQRARLEGLVDTGPCAMICGSAWRRLSRGPCRERLFWLTPRPSTAALRSSGAGGRTAPW